MQHLEHIKRLEHLEHIKRLEHLEHIKRLELNFTCMDYRDYIYRLGDVVYCDIPYKTDKIEYGIEFNHDEFYRWASAQPYDIYFSSYSHGLPVWSKSVMTSYSATATVKKIETLFKL